MDRVWPCGLVHWPHCRGCKLTGARLGHRKECSSRVRSTWPCQPPWSLAIQGRPEGLQTQWFHSGHRPACFWNAMVCFPGQQSVPREKRATGTPSSHMAARLHGRRLSSSTSGQFLFAAMAQAFSTESGRCKTKSCRRAILRPPAVHIGRERSLEAAAQYRWRNVRQKLRVITISCTVRTRSQSRPCAFGRYNTQAAVRQSDGITHPCRRVPTPAIQKKGGPWVG